MRPKMGGRNSGQISARSVEGFRSVRRFSFVPIRTYGAGRPHVGRWPKFLVVAVIISFLGAVWWRNIWMLYLQSRGCRFNSTYKSTPSQLFR